MDDWIYLPETPPTWPSPGERCHFMRGEEISEGFVTVDRVDTQSNIVYFKDKIPEGVKVGDCLIGNLRHGG